VFIQHEVIEVPVQVGKIINYYIKIPYLDVCDKVDVIFLALTQ
jgi:hypothetical protein